VTSLIADPIAEIIKRIIVEFSKPSSKYPCQKRIFPNISAAGSGNI
jgi:hypothetical protein